jgi:hypothetical protein
VAVLPLPDDIATLRLIADDAVQIVAKRPSWERQMWVSLTLEKRLKSVDGERLERLVQTNPGKAQAICNWQKAVLRERNRMEVMPWDPPASWIRTRPYVDLPDDLAGFMALLKLDADNRLQGTDRIVQAFTRLHREAAAKLVALSRVQKGADEANGTRETQRRQRGRPRSKPSEVAIRVWSLYQERKGEPRVLYEISDIVGLTHSEVERTVKMMKARQFRKGKASQNPATKSHVKRK